MSDWIGYRWLAARYGVAAVQAFRTDSAIGKSRATVRENGYVHEQYPPAARPPESLAGHLTFALKHEGVHLEFLPLLFTSPPPPRHRSGGLDRHGTHGAICSSRRLLLRVPHGTDARLSGRRGRKLCGRAPSRDLPTLLPHAQ